MTQPSARVIPANLFISTSIIKITTSNLNGLPANGHRIAKQLVNPVQCLFMQELKFNNSKQLDAFHVHLNNEVGVNSYKLFINDRRTLSTANHAHRANGVATYFHSSMPGFNSLTHMSNLDVADRYMVVKCMWQDHVVYFHNVYAPVVPSDRPDFFSRLPRIFPVNSLHIFGGDFNFPFDETLDSTNHHPDHNAGKAECFEWFSSLRVLEP